MTLNFRGSGAASKIRNLRGEANGLRPARQSERQSRGGGLQDCRSANAQSGGGASAATPRNLFVHETPARCAWRRNGQTQRVRTIRAPVVPHPVCGCIRCRCRPPKRILRPGKAGTRQISGHPRVPRPRRIRPGASVCRAKWGTDERCWLSSAVSGISAPPCWGRSKTCLTAGRAVVSGRILPIRRKTCRGRAPRRSSLKVWGKWCRLGDLNT